MRKASIVASTIAVAAIGSTGLGGLALAGSKHCCESKHSHKSKSHKHSHGNDYARGGDGGKAINNCLNVGVLPIAVGALGQADSNSQYCSANASGGDASNY